MSESDGFRSSRWGNCVLIGDEAEVREWNFHEWWWSYFFVRGCVYACGEVVGVSRGGERRAIG